MTMPPMAWPLVSPADRGSDSSVTIGNRHAPVGRIRADLKVTAVWPDSLMVNRAAPRTCNAGIADRAPVSKPAKSTASAEVKLPAAVRKWIAGEMRGILEDQFAGARQMPRQACQRDQAAAVAPASILNFPAPRLTALAISSVPPAASTVPLSVNAPVIVAEAAISFSVAAGIDLKCSCLDRQVTPEGKCIALRISTLAPELFTTRECAAAAWSILTV